VPTFTNEGLEHLLQRVDTSYAELAHQLAGYNIKMGFDKDRMATEAVEATQKKAKCQERVETINPAAADW